MSTIHLLIVALAVTVANIEADDPTCVKPMDFAFVVDSSASICGGSPAPCDRWYAILKFCKDLVKTMNIGPKATRIAFATISNTTIVEWNFNKYTDLDSVLTAIDNVPYRGGELVDLLSISKVLLDIFNPLWAGDRLFVANEGVLISDGAKNFADELFAVISIAVQLTRGAEVFVVCNQPGCTVKCANGIASPIISFSSKENKNYFLIDDYLSIDRVRVPLAKQICDAPYHLPAK